MKCTRFILSILASALFISSINLGAMVLLRKTTGEQSLYRLLKLSQTNCFLNGCQNNLKCHENSTKNKLKNLEISRELLEEILNRGLNNPNNSRENHLGSEGKQSSSENQIKIPEFIQALFPNSRIIYHGRLDAASVKEIFEKSTQIK